MLLRLIAIVLLSLIASACLGGEPRPLATAIRRPTATVAPATSEPTAVPPTSEAAPAPVATPVPSMPPVPNKWGVHLLLDDGARQWPEEVWEEHLAYARGVVGANGYVVELIRADDLDPVKWQRFLNLADRFRLNPILRLATWQDRTRGHWAAPPKDANGRTYRGLARRFATFVDRLKFTGKLYVIVGNEPNRGDEWGGDPDPSEYAQFLIDVSAALKAAEPGRVQVLNAGLDQYAPDTRGETIDGIRSYDAASFLDGMNSANPRVWEVIDVWASHAYPLGPFAQHPGARDFRIDDLTIGGARAVAAPLPGLFNRGVNSYRWELYKLRSYGVRREFKVIVTETGWRHLESQTRSADSAGAVIPAERAASFIKLAFDGDPLLAPQEYSWTPWAVDPDVGAVVLFALDGDPARWGHTNLLELAADGKVIGLKPQFAELIKD